MEYISKHRFELFLVSFLILLFGDALIPAQWKDGAILIFLIQNIVCSLLLFVDQPKRKTYLMIFVAGATILMAIIRYWNPGSLSYVYSFFILVYFLLVGHTLFKLVLAQKVVSLKTVAAVFCGFMLLAMVATIVFSILHVSQPAFKGIEDNDFSSLLYFSFITLLTIGYGDITPTSYLAQRLVILFGLIGNFYSVFVIALFVGKYMSSLED